MSQLLIRDLDPEFLEQLKERAKQNHRSLSAEVKVLLEEALPRRKTLEERRAARQRLIEYSDWALAQSQGIAQTNSTDIIREYRGPLGP
jgi:plasmid stability protein